MKKLYSTVILAAGLLFVLVLGGCSQGEEASAAEMLSNVVESQKELKDYYGELHMSVHANNQVQHTTMKEYSSEKGQRKVVIHNKEENEDIINLFDGQKMLIYEPASKKAYEMRVEEDDLMGLFNPKDQIMKILELVKDTHELEMLGEEEVLGIKVNHLRLKSVDEDSFLGTMDFWIDPKTWLPLKSISDTGDERIEVYYTKLDFSPKFARDTFTLKLPKDVKVETLDGEDSSVQEAEKSLGKPFLIFPDNEQMKLASIQDLGGDLQEFTFNYQDAENKPLFSLTVFPPDQETGKLRTGKWQVRGQPAEVMKEIDGIAWNEDGLRYVVIMEQPEILKIEDVIRLAKDMVYSSEK